MKKNKSIIFDLGGVLININYQNTIRQFRNLGIHNSSFYSQDRQNKIFNYLETGKISSNEFVLKLQKYCNATKQELISSWNKMILDIPEERIHLIKNLKKKYNLYLLSNTNPIHIKEIKKKYGKQKYKSFEKLFNKVYYSHKIKLRKPDPRAFKLIINENVLDPETILFIDDSEQHIRSAKKLGISCYHLKKGEEIINLFPDIIQSKHYKCHLDEENK